MLFRISWVLLCLLFAAKVSADYQIGNLRGDTSVSNGTLNYTIPLSLPDGVNGLSHPMSIRYQQGGGNGILGAGFSLSGLSAIARCVTSRELDGFENELTRGRNTRYCLDGNRLVGSGSELFIQKDSNTRVELIGSRENPSGFKVYEATGMILSYERAPGLPTSSVHSTWVLSEKEDRFGNSMIFEYVAHGARPAISNIQYSGYEISFHYRRIPKTPSYIGGYTYENQLLERIELHDRSFLKWTYHIGYEELYATEYHINQINFCIAGGDCFKPLEFAYETMQQDSYQTSRVAVNRNDILARNEKAAHLSYVPVDLENDGVVELCFLSPKNKAVYCGSSAGDIRQVSKTFFAWNNDDEKIRPYVQSSLTFLDLNNDLYADMCVVFKDGMYCAHNRGDGTFDDGQIISDTLDPKTPYSFVDIDRDLLVDLCFAEDGAYRCHIQNSSNTRGADAAQYARSYQDINYAYGKRAIPQSGFFKATVTLLTDNDFGYQKEWYWIGINKEEDRLQMPPPLWLDVNGDKAADFCYLNSVFTDDQSLPEKYNETEPHFPDIETEKLYGHLVCHSGSFSSGMLKLGGQQSQRNFFSDKKVEVIPDSSLVDINVITLDQIEQEIQRYEARKKELEEVVLTLRYFDVNSDGLSDMCYLQDTDMVCHLNRGNGYTDANVYASFRPIYNNMHIQGNQRPNTDLTLAREIGAYHSIDINLDGLQDLCTLWGNEYYCALFNGKHFAELSPIVELDPDYDYENSTWTYPGDNRVQMALGNSTRFYTKIAQYQIGPIRLVNNVKDGGGFELCYRGNRGIHCHDWSALDLPDTPASRLVSITDSFGMRTQIRYASTMNPKVYTLDDEWKERTLYDGYIGTNPGLIVVSEIHTDTPVMDEHREIQQMVTRYQYKNYLLHPHKGPLGFTTDIRIDETRNQKNVSHYFIHPRLSGQTQQVQHYVGDELTKRLENQVQVLESNNHRDAYRIQTNKSEEKNYDNGQLLTTKQTWYRNFDHLGFPQQVMVHRADAQNNWVRQRTDTTFQHNESSWILGKPSLIQATHSGSGLTSVRRKTQMVYDSNGLIKQSILEPGDANQLTTDYEHNDRGLVTRKIVSGRVNLQGRLQQRSMSTTYDALGRVKTVKNSLNHTTTYEYDPFSHCRAPVTVIDANGLKIRTEYDEACQKIKVIHPDQTYQTWDYQWVSELDFGVDFQGQNIPVNQIPSYKMRTANSTGAWSESYFDTLGRKLRTVQYTEAGEILTDKLYNVKGDMVAASMPYYRGDFGGSGVSWNLSTYDDKGRIATLKAADGSISRYQYNGLSQTVFLPGGAEESTTMDLLGNVALKTDANGRQISYVYDAIGQLRSTTTQGNVISMRHDRRGNRYYMKDPTMGEWRYYFNAFGELVRQKDGNNQITDMEYDQLGRMTRRTSRDEDTEWRYDTAKKGLLTYSKDKHSQRFYSYDGLMRVKTDTLRVDGETFETTYIYDQASRLVEVANASGVNFHYEYDVNGRRQSISMPRDQIWNYDYQMVRVALELMAERIEALEIKANEYTTKMAEYRKKADDYMVIHRDLINQKNRYESLAKKYEEKAKLLYSQARHYSNIGRSYHATSNRLKQQFGELVLAFSGYAGNYIHYSNTRCYDRHRLGRCKRKHNAHAYILKSWVEIKKVCRRRGPKFRRYTRCYQQPEDVKPYEVYRKQARKYYLMASRLDATAERYEERDYDDNARNAKKEAAKYLELAKNLYAEANKLQLVLNRILKELSELEKAQEKLAKTDLQADLPDGNALLWAATGYNAQGALSGETFGNGTKIHREWDDMGRIKRIHSTVGGGTTLRDLEYEYNERGLISEKFDRHLNQFENFDYDTLGRLSEWDITYDHRYRHSRFDWITRRYHYSMSSSRRTKRISYEHDERGNMTRKDHILMHYNQANQLTRSESGYNRKGYTYDRVGNMLQRGQYTHQQWTSFNKIKQINKRGQVTDFKYNGDRSRLIQESKDRVVYYVRPDLEKEIRYEDGNEIIVWRHHLMAGNDVVATYEKRVEEGEKTADQVAYIHRDHQGSADTITDAHGNVIARNLTTPYGMDINTIEYKDTTNRANKDHHQATMEQSSDGAQNFINQTNINHSEVHFNESERMEIGSQILPYLRGYTSHEHLREHNLIHMNARLYDPLIGRFISADTLIPNAQKVDAYNRYQYVYGNPVNYRDPDGHNPYAIAVAIYIYIASQAADDQRIQVAGAVTAAVIAGPALTETLTPALGVTGASIASGATITFIQTYNQTGQLGTALRESAWAGLSAGIATEIGGADGSYFNAKLTFDEKVLLHGLTRASIEAARNRSFERGFISGAIGKLASPVAFGAVGDGAHWTDRALRTSIAAGMGYLADTAAGGDGSTGAMAAAFVHMYNGEASEQKSGIDWQKQAGATDADLAEAKRLWALAKTRRLADGSIPDSVQALLDLESGKFKTTILVGSAGNSAAPDSIADAMDVDVGSAGTIKFNPWKVGSMGGGIHRSPEASLVHEAYHVRQFNTGTLQSSNMRQHAEVGATSVENWHRKAMGLPQRTSYGSWSVPTH